MKTQPNYMFGGAGGAVGGGNIQPTPMMPPMGGPPGASGGPPPGVGYAQPGGAAGGPPTGMPLAPGPQGAPTGGVPPHLADIWHLLPPQLQGLLGGGQSPFAGLLGQLGGGGGYANPLMGLLARRQQPTPTPTPVQASGNPYQVPQTY